VPLPKPSDYYSVARSDLVPQLPAPLGNVLDVGCGTGASAELLRARGPERLIGIEINPEAAAAARGSYDEVLVGPAEEVLPRLNERFDTVLCYDVLEHMVDPWRVLAEIARVSSPGARLHVSVPNARHVSLLLDLAVRGTFNYQPWGHRDDTHLRWFTPRDLETAIRQAGFEVKVRSHPEISAARRFLGTVTGGRSTEFLVWQWQVLAVREPAR
jgi:SAM-dependent methyltransferase